MSEQMQNICGNCTLCCKLLGVQELDKPPNKWCVLCDIGEGCSIYPDRPRTCRDFECGYLLSNLPINFRPDKLHMVITGETADGSVLIHVDPHYPNAVNTANGQRILNMIHNSGKSAILVIGDKRKLLSTSFKDLEQVNRMIRNWEKKGNENG
jgi:uncharacterized protein